MMNIALDVVDIALRPPEQMSQRTRHFRKPFRTYHDQCDCRDDQNFRETDIEHFGKNNGSIETINSDSLARRAVELSTILLTLIRRTQDFD